MGVGLGHQWQARSPDLITHLIQAALQDDNQGENDCMQAEEGVITVDRVHTIGIFEEKLLLLGGGEEKLRGEEKQLGWAVGSKRCCTWM